MIVRCYNLKLTLGQGKGKNILQTYSIGATAKKMNVTVETLRYYEKEGLLPFVKRDAAGRRVFSTDE